MKNKRPPLTSWSKFLPMTGESRYSRQLRRAADDPEYKAHLDAVRRMPSAVQEAWALYENDVNHEIYPFGFAYHFPRQWRWKEIEDGKASGKKSLSQRALEASGLGSDTERRPDGSVDRWPSGRPVGTDSPGVDPDFDDTVDEHVTGYWRDQHNGRLYVIDRITGEVLDEVGEEPPF